MKKFEFVADELPKQKFQKDTVSYFTSLQPFTLSLGNSAYITSKKEHIAKLLEEFYDLYKERKNVRYVRMNTITQNLLRMYYNYEVNYVNKELKKKFDYDIQGLIMGYGIIIDEKCLTNDIVPTIYRGPSPETLPTNNKKRKFKYL